MAELVPGIGQRNGLGPIRNAVTGEDLDAFRAGEPIGVKAKLSRQFPVQADEPGGPDRGWRQAREKAVGQAGVGIVKGKMKHHGPPLWSECRTKPRPV